MYAKKLSDSHEKFLVSGSGLHVNPKWPHQMDLWSVLAVVKVSALTTKFWNSSAKAMKFLRISKIP